MKPRLSMHLVNFSADPPHDWQRLFDLAAAADRAGIGRLVVSDHVAYGERLDRYADADRGGLAGGRQPTGPDGAWLEPLTVLAMVGAGVTDFRIGLRPPQGTEQAAEYLAPWVEAFEAAAGA